MVAGFRGKYRGGRRASVAAVAAPDDRQATREHLLASLHDAGIERDSPLGVLFLRQSEATADACEQMFHATAAAEALLVGARKELSTLRSDLEAGREQVNQMAQIAQTNIRKQELFRQRELQAALDGLVSGLTADLKERVFDALREEIPASERRFYREARWAAYVRMILAGAILITLGFSTGITWNWHAARTGRFCEDNYHRDPTSGMTWCALDPLPNGSPEAVQTKAAR